ncbi:MULTISPECIES: DsbA family protein [unclassified Meridianimarinicoccus]|uniref:DsbA family protein n=1 Tax=unclassified Meridianimarinicoccus TaxID=2923344 RepID=UPI00186698CF|nr:DsbA family protein [Fluviibacterium sp. MJW13]
MLLKHLLAPALAVAALALPASALDLKDLSEAERTALRAEVRAYLLDNPEVLMEAIGILEQRQAVEQAHAEQQMMSGLQDEIYNDGWSWEGGNPDGDITLVEFVDYRCGYCRKAHDEVAELVSSDGNIRLILKEFPILGEDSLMASRFAIATRMIHGNDAYKRAHDRLITMTGSVNEAALSRLARDLDLDQEAVMAAMNDDKVVEELRGNRDLAQKLEISGTPTFILQGDMLRGYVPLPQMRELVAQARTAD